MKKLMTEDQKKYFIKLVKASCALNMLTMEDAIKISNILYEALERKSSKGVEHEKTL